MFHVTTDKAKNPNMQLVAFCLTSNASFAP